MHKNSRVFACGGLGGGKGLPRNSDRRRSENSRGPPAKRNWPNIAQLVEMCVKRTRR